MIQYLVDKGADPKPSGGNYSDSLNACILEGHLENLKSLLDEVKILADMMHCQGRNAINAIALDLQGHWDNQLGI